MYIIFVCNAVTSHPIATAKFLWIIHCIIIFSLDKTMPVMPTDKQVMFKLYSPSEVKVNLFKGLCVGLNDNAIIWNKSQ